MLLLKNQNFNCRTEAYVRIETHDDEDDEKGSSRTSCPPDQRYLFCFIPLRTWSVGGTWWWWWPSGADISAPYGLSWHAIVLLVASAFAENHRNHHLQLFGRLSKHSLVIHCPHRPLGHAAGGAVLFHTLPKWTLLPSSHTPHDVSARVSGQISTTIFSSVKL